MRLTSLRALASRQAINHNPSDGLALVSCSDSLGSGARSSALKAHRHARPKRAPFEQERVAATIGYGADRERLGHCR